MAEIATLARPYAEATFRLAQEQQTLAAWSVVLDRLARVAGAAHGLIGHPNINVTQLEDLFCTAVADDMGAGASEQVVNLVHLLIENGRLVCLPEIAEQFEALKRRGSGIREAAIHSAFPMDDAQAQSLKALLEDRFQTTLKISVTVSPELIGGIRAVVDDQVLDTSVRGRLDAMAAALSS